MTDTGEDLGYPDVRYPPGRSRATWRGVLGVVLLVLAALYGFVVALATALIVVIGRSAEDEPFAYSSPDPFALMSLPLSLFGPGEVLRASDWLSTGLVHCLFGFLQAGLLACAGWALLRAGRGDRGVRVPVVIAIALVSVGATAAVLTHDPPLQLPDRGDPAVVAEEARLAKLVGATDEYGPGADCHVRLIKRDGPTSYGYADCVHPNGFSEGAGPFRVIGTTVEMPLMMSHDEDQDRLFPDDVQRVIVFADREDLLRPE